MFNFLKKCNKVLVEKEVLGNLIHDSYWHKCHCEFFDEFNCLSTIRSIREDLENNCKNWKSKKVKIEILDDEIKLAEKFLNEYMALSKMLLGRITYIQEKDLEKLKEIKDLYEQLKKI